MFLFKCNQYNYYLIDLAKVVDYELFNDPEYEQQHPMPYQPRDFPIFS